MAIAILVAAQVAVAKNPVKEFYDAKQKTTQHEAFLRCEQRLREVRPGMSERELLQVLDMALLARGKKAMDAAIDGYLAEASVRANRGGASERHMVFGWIERGQEQPKVTVVLRDHKVVSVVAVEPPARVAAMKTTPTSAEP